MTDKQKPTLTWRERVDRFIYPVKKVVAPVKPQTAAPLGSTANGTGTTFRVWAPHAEKVFVSGSFNDWSRWRTPLAREKNGHWSAVVAKAQPGDEYKYAIHYADDTLLRTDPYARDIAPGHSNAIITADAFDWEEDPERPFQTPAWNDLVIYELHVGTFTTDPTQPNDPIGTFTSLIDKLPYLKELGINAIELMPVKEFDGDYSWGYNPAHPFAVTRTYGGRVALKKLVKAAHQHDMAVILDVVYNHFGPQDLHLWRFDGWHQDGKGGIYFYNDWRSKTPWADTRPDYGRDEVRAYIQDNVRMWLEEFRLDGLRWDATSYIRNAHGHDGDSGADIADGWSLMQTINDEIDERHPWKINIAEDLQSNEWVTKPTADSGAGFDSQWSAEFVHPIREAIITAHDEDRDLNAVADALGQMYDGDAFRRVIFTESHDEVANGKARVPEEISPGEADTYFAKKRSTLGAALVFTAPGIPMLFQGQEFLADRWFTDQEPLDWQRAEQYGGLVDLYRDLIHLRRNKGGVTRGLMGHHMNVFHINNTDKILAFHRWDQGGATDDVIVVANFSHRPFAAYALGFPQEGLWRVRFNGCTAAYDPEFESHPCPDVIAATAGQDGLAYRANVTIGPYSALVFSQDA